MKMLLRKLLSKVPNPSVAFTAKSALIATTLAATGRAFAGGAPSSGGLLSKNVRKMTFTKTQSEVLKSLIIERLDSPALSEQEAQDLESIIEKIELSKSEENPKND